MYSIKSRIWIETKNGPFLGEGRVRLLKAIQETGSLSKAAKTLEMSYKKAWHLVDSINKSASEPLTISNKGGKGGGGLTLTDYGLKMITAFEHLNHRCWDFLDEEFQKFKF